MSAEPRIVVVGGGFGGLNAARRLKRAKAQITVIDRRNYHLFQPLLYQVATAALNPGDIAYPIRRVLHHQKNADVFLAEVTAIDAPGKKVILTDGEMPFDMLVLATGATHSYFGHGDWAHFAPGLKTVEDAIEIRRRVLIAYEAAERETDPDARAAWLTFVIIGGGPTGVELAGAFAEISRQTLVGDFRHINPAEARVILIEGADRILPYYAPASSHSARHQLEHLGVDVRVSSVVTEIDEQVVTYKLSPKHDAKADSKPEMPPPEQALSIRARSVVWAAGVAASPVAKSLGVPLDRAGRVKVNPDLTIPGHPDIYVIGDLAAVEQGGKPVPGVAPAAIQEGKYVAQHIMRRLQQKPTEPFHYWDKGSLATIGRSSAVAEIGRVKIGGFIAWLMWLFIHILYLVGFRNRFLVVSEWAWSYITFGRGARLITGASPPRMVQALPVGTSRALISESGASSPAVDKQPLPSTRQGPAAGQ